jgi:hypothetical protein
VICPANPIYYTLKHYETGNSSIASWTPYFIVAYAGHRRDLLACRDTHISGTFMIIVVDSSIRVEAALLLGLEHGGTPVARWSAKDLFAFERSAFRSPT